MKTIRDPHFLQTFLDQEIYIVREEKPTYNSQDPKKPEKEDHQKIEIEGKSSSDIAVVVPDDITPDEKSLLTKILGSMDRTIDDIAVLQIRRDNPSFEIPSSLSAVKIISFGVTSEISPGLNIDSKYTPTTISGRTFLISDKLSALNAEVELKKKLWAVLQQLF